MKIIIFPTKSFILNTALINTFPTSGRVWAFTHKSTIVSLRQKNGSVTLLLDAVARLLSFMSWDDMNTAWNDVDSSINSRISEDPRNGVNSSSSIIRSGSADGPLLNRSVCFLSVALTMPSLELSRKWQSSGTKLQENCHITTRWNFLLKQTRNDCFSRKINRLNKL